MPMTQCSLCFSDDVQFYAQDRRRSYWQCGCCKLVMADSSSWLSAQQEKQIYDLHENQLDDPGYQRFLMRIAEPLLARLPANSQGLDFGCGPAPLLAQLLTAAGHQVALYDIFYQPDQQVLQQQYDFICCSEAIEHFNQPAQQWQLWLSLLKPQGMLAIMTKRVRDADAFSRWHYKNDLTHVSFFSEATFAYLAKRDGFSLEVVADDVVILHRLGENL